MAGSPFKNMVANAREEALSSDINRAQKLSSTALQESIRRSQLDSTGTPVSCFTEVPSLVAVPATFNMALGLGQAMVNDSSGITSDDSAMKVVEWAAQNLSFANPDPSNPRVDLVVVTPATLNSDLSVRNILLDPVARTFAPASVPKTNAPTVVPVVITGTAAASPVPPAVPGGAFAMFEVSVPAAAADSTTFVTYQRLFRRSTYPLVSGFSEEPETAVLRGCRLAFVPTFAAISQPSLGGNIENQVVIDGEVISFAALTSLNNNDTLANPFAGPAPSGNDVPFFLYVVGGRGAPQGYPNAAPAALVASTTPPDVRSGRPSSPIQAPRGAATQSAVYVGIGFVRKGSSNYQIVQHVDDEVWFASTTAADPGFEDALTEGAGDNPVTLLSCPNSCSTRVRLKVQNITGGLELTLRQTSQPTSVAQWTKTYGGVVGFDGNATIPIPGNSGGPHFKAFVTLNAVDLVPVAYNMRVRRLG